MPKLINHIETTQDKLMIKQTQDIVKFKYFWKLNSKWFSAKIAKSIVLVRQVKISFKNNQLKIMMDTFH